MSSTGQCLLRVRHVSRVPIPILQYNDDIVLQIVIRCVGTKRAVKMSYSKGIFFRFFFLYQFLFPHELIADLRRLIAHKRHGDRSQKNTRLSGPVRNPWENVYRYYFAPRMVVYLEIYELGAKGLARLRKVESKKHRLVTE